jgi:hypothetical protein
VQWREGAAAVELNVAYANGGSGLVTSTSPDGSLFVGCNDLYLNTGWGGNGAGPQDWELDPLFCNLAEDDVRLAPGSPLRSLPGCAIPGAAVDSCPGDGTTAVLARVFEARRIRQGVELRWSLAGEEATRIEVERATSEAGPWSPVETGRTLEGEMTIAFDGSAGLDRAYWYRLVAVDRGAGQVIGHMIRVGSGEGDRVSFGRITPNPARGHVQIEFTLADRTAIEVGLFDLQGRAVVTLASGSWEAGPHRVEWNGMAPGKQVRPGVYLVKLTYPGGARVQRLIRVD